jgi:tetratricopeptide (TPR) repeat protein
MREEHLAWLDRLDDEHENLRAAFELLLDDPSDAGPALRLAGALLWWWEIRGEAVSGGQLVERALVHPAADAALPEHRARALVAAGHLAVVRGAHAHAAALLERASSAAGEAGRPALAALALRWAAFAEHALGDRDRAATLLDEALALARASHDRYVEAQVLSIALYRDAPAELRAQAIHESLAIFAELGDLRWTPITLNNLGNDELRAGEVDAAREHLEESIRLARLIGNESALCFTTSTLVLACIEQGELAAASDHLDDLEARAERLGYLGITPYVLLGHALLASRDGRHELAARLHGAADAALRLSGDAAFDIAEEGLLEPDRKKLRTVLGDAEFERLAERGAALGAQQAIAVARAAREG